MFCLYCIFCNLSFALFCIVCFICFVCLVLFLATMQCSVHHLTSFCVQSFSLAVCIQVLMCPPLRLTFSAQVYLAIKKPHKTLLVFCVDNYHCGATTLILASLPRSLINCNHSLATHAGFSSENTLSIGLVHLSPQGPILSCPVSACISPSQTLLKSLTSFLPINGCLIKLSQF